MIGLSLLLLLVLALAEASLLFPVSFMVTKGVLFSDDMTHSRGNRMVWTRDITIIIDGVSLLCHESVRSLIEKTKDKL